MFLLQLCKFESCSILALEKGGHELGNLHHFEFIIRCKFYILFSSCFLKFFNVVFAYTSLVTCVSKDMGGFFFFGELVI